MFLSRHPHTEEKTKNERLRLQELEVILYSSICEVVNEYLNTIKVPDDLQKEALSISCMVQSNVEEVDAEEI